MILLDTCVLLWLVSDQSRLTEAAKVQIASSADGRFVSAISAFEIGLKHAKGKLSLGVPPEEWFRSAIAVYGLKPLPITWEIGLAATELPPIHADPADRIIIATAAMHKLSIITSDRNIPKYPGTTVTW